MPLLNWARNLEYSARAYHCPSSIAELQDVVARSSAIRALGTRHSFNGLADITGDLVSLQSLPVETTIVPERRVVTVGGAATYGGIARYLNRRGYALRNLASLPHISVVGGCATATHGSGVANGSLSTSVAAMEIVAADGTIASFSREQDAEQFDGMVVHLGGLGVVTQITLDIVPTFEIRQDIYDNLPLDQLDAHFEEIMGAGYSVSLFTNWQTDVVKQVWVKRLVSDREPFTPEPIWFGATLARSPRHPIPDASPENSTPQLGEPGPWHERLPHFRFEHTPSHGEELQTEYFVAREHAVAAIHSIEGLRDQLAPLILVTEIRAIAADNLWLSPAYRRDSVGIHFTWRSEWQSVKALLPEIERRLAPFSPRPHWAKLFTMPGEQVQAGYEKLPQFLDLLRRVDPGGKFRNEFLSSTLGA